MLTDRRADPGRDLRPHLPGRNSPHTARRGDYGGRVPTWRSLLVAGLATPGDDLDGYPLAAGLSEGDYGSLTPRTPNLLGY